MAKATKTVKTDLLIALDFVKLIASDGGVVGMGDNVLSVVTPVMRAYHPVGDDLRFTTDLDKFHAAIRTIGERAYSATIAQTLKISAGKFKIELPIIEVEAIKPPTIDDVATPVNEGFINALVNASVPTKSGAGRVAYAGVYSSASQTFIGTNGNVLVEAWHGIDMMTDIIIPTDFINIIKKVHASNPLTHVYADERIFAARFANNAIMITQLFVEQYVNAAAILAMSETAKPEPMPDDLRGYFDELAPFGDTINVTAGAIECGRASITTLSQHAYKFKVDNWKLISALVTKADFGTLANMVVFFGPMLRGCFTKVDKDQ